MCSEKIFGSDVKGSILIDDREVSKKENKKCFSRNLNLSQLENAINPTQKPFLEISLKSDIIKSIRAVFI